MYRHGDLLIIPCEKVIGKKLSHLILARGEITGHKHEVIGSAELFEENGTLYLKVKESAQLTHPEHKTITLPTGNYEVKKQREYVVGDKKYRRVMD
jgi:hypothetical protein